MELINSGVNIAFYCGKCPPKVFCFISLFREASLTQNEHDDASNKAYLESKYNVPYCGFLM